LLYKIREKQEIEIWGDGKIVRDYFYIRDGVRSVYKAMQYKGNKSVFNISSGKGYSIVQILEMFRKVLKLEFEVKYLPPRKFDVKVNILDNKLAGKELNWKPETKIEEALKRTWRYVCDY
ncbi:MAG: GDP-mannose 4,6-dehydratase, partial [Ignavibacteria bacterium]